MSDWIPRLHKVTSLLCRALNRSYVFLFVHEVCRDGFLNLNPALVRLRAVNNDRASRQLVWHLPLLLYGQKVVISVVQELANIGGPPVVLGRPMRGHTVQEVLFLPLRIVLLCGHHDVVHDVHLPLAFQISQVTLLGRLIRICNVAVSRWSGRRALSLSFSAIVVLGLVVI